MNIGRLSGGLPYTFGQGWKNALETSGCKTVYDANPSAIIRKNPDKIVAKSHYTEDEALWNQYMKPYRDALKIVDDQLVVNADIRHLAPYILTKTIPSEELESFQRKLEQEGIGDEIDWWGVKYDFQDMDINFRNAGYLNTRIDYIASRCAVLKDRIERNYFGEEKEQQLSKLNEILDHTKKTMIDSYCGSVGNFYEECGYSEAKTEMAESLSKGIDQRISQYEEHLQQSESYAALRNTTVRWMQQDDGYMAARLREDMNAYDRVSTQTSSTKTEEMAYTLQDLEIAGIYSAECQEQLDNQGGTFWSDNEQRIGLDLAVQGMKTDYLAKHAGLSNNMQNLLQNTFQSYKDNYIDTLEQMLKEKAKQFFTPFKTSVNREEINEVYTYTMMQYRQSGNILDAFTQGAKQARSIAEAKFYGYGRQYHQAENIPDIFTQESWAKFEELFFEKEENRDYSAKHDWDNFFVPSDYTRFTKEDSMYVKYQKSINRFLESLESGNYKKIHLLFGSSGDYELNLFA